MGRSTTPKYAVHFRCRGCYTTPKGWNSKYMGRPTLANLTKYVELMRAGGVNAPLDVIEATLKINSWNGGIIATWTAPEGTPVLPSPFPARPAAPTSYTFTLETAA